MAFEEVRGEMYRARVMNDDFGTVAAPVDLDANSTETSLTITSTDVPIQSIRAIQPIANATLESEGMSMSGTATSLLRIARRRLLQQVLHGTGTSPQLVSFDSTLTAVTVAANTNILNHATNGLDTRFAAQLGAGYGQGYALLQADEAAKVYGTLKDYGWAVPMGIQASFPFGGTLGNYVILTPELENNNAIIGPFGNPDAHLVAMRGGYRIEMSEDQEFTRDNTVVRLVVRCRERHPAIGRFRAFRERQQLPHRPVDGPPRRQGRTVLPSRPPLFL